MMRRPGKRRGASSCCAIEAQEENPDLHVVILEGEKKRRSENELQDPRGEVSPFGTCPAARDALTIGRFYGGEGTSLGKKLRFSCQEQKNDNHGGPRCKPGDKSVIYFRRKRTERKGEKEGENDAYLDIPARRKKRRRMPAWGARDGRGHVVMPLL